MSPTLPASVSVSINRFAPFSLFNFYSELLAHPSIGLPQPFGSVYRNTGEDNTRCIPSCVSTAYSRMELGHIYVFLTSIAMYNGDCTAVLRAAGASADVTWVVSRAFSFLQAVLRSQDALRPLVPHLHSRLWPDKSGLVAYNHTCSTSNPAHTDYVLPPLPLYQAQGSHRFAYDINTDRMLNWEVGYPPTKASIDMTCVSTQIFYQVAFPPLIEHLQHIYLRELNADGVCLADQATEEAKALLEFVQRNPVIDFLCFAAVFGGLLQYTGEFFNRMLLDGLTTKLRMLFHAFGVGDGSLPRPADWQKSGAAYLCLDPAASPLHVPGKSALFEGMHALMEDTTAKTFLTILTSDLFCTLGLRHWDMYYDKHVCEYMTKHAHIPACSPHVAAVASVYDGPLLKMREAYVQQEFTIISRLVLQDEYPLRTMFDTPIRTLQGVRDSFLPSLRYPEYSKQSFGERELCILNDILLSGGYDSDLFNTILGRRKATNPELAQFTGKSFSGAILPVFTVCPTRIDLGGIQRKLPTASSDPEAPDEIYLKIDVEKFLQFRLQNTTETQFFTYIDRKVKERIQAQYAHLYRAVVDFKTDVLGGVDMQTYLNPSGIDQDFVYNVRDAILYGEGANISKTEEMNQFLERNPSLKVRYDILKAGMESIRNLYQYSKNLYVMVYREALEQALDHSVRIAENYAHWHIITSPEACRMDAFPNLSLSGEGMSENYIAFGKTWLSRAVLNDRDEYIKVRVAYLQRRKEGKLRDVLLPEADKKSIYGRRATYLFLEIPSLQSHSPLFLIVTKRRDDFFVHLTGGFMLDLIRAYTNHSNNIDMDNYLPLALPLHFLPHRAFTKCAVSFRPILGDAVDYEHLMNACLCLSRNIRSTKDWTDLNKHETFEDEYLGSNIRGVYGAKRFLTAYSGHIDPHLRELLHKHHNIPDPAETIAAPKRPRGRPPKVKDSEETSHTAARVRQVSRTQFRKKQSATDFSILEDKYIQIYLRPRMLSGDRMRLCALCGDKSWYLIEARGKHLAKLLLDSGVYEITRLPIAVHDGTYKEHLVKNLMEALKDNRVVSRGLSIEQLIEKYTTYPRGYARIAVPELEKPPQASTD